MTIAARAVGGAIGGNAGGRRLAAPGAILMTAGLVILWWGLGIFRGETGAAMAGSNLAGKRIIGAPFPKRRAAPPSDTFAKEREG